MPCPFTPILPFLASLPLLPWVRKRLKFRKISQQHEQMNSLLPEGWRSGLKGTDLSTLYVYECDLPVPKGLRWDIYPKGAPHFISTRALELFHTSYSNAQAALLSRSLNFKREYGTEIKKAIEKIFSSIDEELVSFLRIEGHALQVRFAQVDTKKEKMIQVFESLTNIVQEFAANESIRASSATQRG